jgi:hypothetical protein
LVFVITVQAWSGDGGFWRRNNSIAHCGHIYFYSFPVFFLSSHMSSSKMQV